MHRGQKEPLHREEEREKKRSCWGRGLGRMCRLERKSSVKGIGIKQRLGEAWKERNRQRILASSQIPKLSKSLYIWVCLYLPRITQNPTAVLQSLHPPTVPKTSPPIPDTAAVSQLTLACPHTSEMHGPLHKPSSYPPFLPKLLCHYHNIETGLPMPA